MRAAVRVLDSYSLIAYVEGEAGKDTMIEIFRSARDSGKACLLSVVNWGEVYYITLREAGQERADQVAHLISTLPIHIVPADLDLAKQAAIFKSNKKMSFADCFAAALAKHRRVELVTGDEEFKEVEKEVKILWL
ncbi:MAG TPA: type II toxin-antitoxin system VapC family toxin [Candidatus Binatia bacterium]|nr:type II toxin-antitoxin system VapC family toxin [Candidatus Binatia bacterium]